MHKVLQVLLPEMLCRERSVSDGDDNGRADDEHDAGANIQHTAADIQHAANIQHAGADIEHAGAAVWHT